MSTATGEFVLGQYKIGKSIGQGTFGKVRLGIHLPTGQKVAVKTLQKEKIVEQADIERVTREICILKVLRHPNIIQLYEIIQTKTDIHLIMEYAEGGELFDYIVKRKRLDQKEAVAFMHQIIAGVEYIHKNGIVHRDLKPQNLLLDHNRNIKIVDFGLSNQYKPGQKLKTACGSPCYASPEMIAGKRYECLGTDLWSCGIILYAMLCGYLPFQDPNTNKLYKKIMAGEYDTPKILSNQSKDLLKGILSTNPDTRFKLQQIRQSKWFNQLASVYSAQGTIVGKDQIEVDERILRKMQQQGHDVQQARSYVLNNRHNQTTALYYLLKIKGEREPEFLQTQEEKRREESPLVYRPETKKEYYLPVRAKPKEAKEQDKNDSMNVSNIISSLVEANKSKIVTRFGNSKRESSIPTKETNFDKLEDFKLFPNKKNSSIYEPRPHNARQSQDKSIETARERDRTAEKSLEPKPKLTPNAENSARGEDTVNKKRQELSDQLRQISIKIDQEIHELRKQNTNARNNSTSSSVAKKRESLAPSSALSSRIKTQQNSVLLKSANRDPAKDSLNTSRDAALFASKEKARQSTIKTPKIHSGPFNAQCVFMESAKNLLDRITGLLLKLNMRYQQTEAFSIFVSGGPHIAIECVQGITGLHLVKFQSEHPINSAILQVLPK